MTQSQFERQLKKLLRVRWTEWEDALEELTPKISRLLHGHVYTDTKQMKHVVGGYTIFGAHSGHELGGEALYHYQGYVVEKLYDGTYEWQPGVRLADILKEIAEKEIPQVVKDYKTRIKTEERFGFYGNFVSLDEKWMGGQDDDKDDETEYQLALDDGKELGVRTGGAPAGKDATEFLVLVMKDNEASESSAETGQPEKDGMEMVTNEVFCVDPEMNDIGDNTKPLDDYERKKFKLHQAAKGDPELERFLKAHEDGMTIKEMREQLGITQKVRDKLIKRLRSRVKTTTKKNGKKKNNRRQRR